jgi:hypothetical protein
VLRLTEGSFATGGEGADQFELGGGALVIADYDPALDQLILLHEGGPDAPAITVTPDGEDALILMDGELLARVNGGAGLQVQDIVLRAV